MTEDQLPKIAYGIKGDTTTKKDRAKHFYIQVQIVKEKIENSERLYKQVFENPEIREQLREDFDYLPEDFKW